MNSKEFIKAVDLIVKEKGIDRELVFEAMELALATAYKKNFDSLTNSASGTSAGHKSKLIISFLSTNKYHESFFLFVHNSPKHYTVFVPKLFAFHKNIHYIFSYILEKTVYQTAHKKCCSVHV